MNTPLTPLIDFAGTVLRLSLQASLVIVLVLLVQWLGRKHLSPRVRYALWLLVVLRLVLPTSLESRVSVFQQARTATTTIVRAAKPAPAAPATVPAKTVTQTSTAPSPVPATAAPPPTTRTAVPVSAPLTSTKSTAAPWPWPLILSCTWLAGVVSLLVRVIWIPLRLNARLARQETATPPAVFEILEQAKRSLGVNQVLPIVQSRAVESPALLGFIRPWLLLPHGLVEKFSPEELRLVFLHELAHLKRRDIAVNWLATLLQILHWFNPLVWYAFARMRADREEACDELALAHARAGEGRAYGHAIIKLLEGFARPPALPGLVGILEDKQHMQRRITMIAQFKKMIPWSAPAAGLLLVLGIVTLTDAQTEKGAPRQITPLAGVSVKTLVSGKSDDVTGVLSPDESMIAYTSWTNAGDALAVKNLKTGEVKTLLSFRSERELAMEPVWSHDSKSLAYYWRVHKEATTYVRICSLQNGESRTVWTAPDSDTEFISLDWSRNGEVLAGMYYRKGKPNALATMTVATGEIHEVTAPWPMPEHVRFSPDARWLVYERIVDGNRDVYVSAVDGRQTNRLTDSPSEDGTPIFSADGRHILFSTNRRGGWDLWALPFEAGRTAGAAFPIKYDFGDRTKQLTASGKLVFRIGPSGDMDRMSADIYVLDASRTANGEPTLIAKSGFGRNYSPSWSPDGKRIAYNRLRGAGAWQSILCVQTLADGREELFETGMAKVIRIHWAPDNQTLMLQGGGPDGFGAYLFSLAAKEPVLRRFGDNSGHGFSRDGKEFVFFDAEKKSRIAVNIATGAQRNISSAEDRARIASAPSRISAREISTSPDESMIAYIGRTDSEEQIIVAAADYSNKRVIAHIAAPDALSRVRLSPDKTKVLYCVRIMAQNKEIQLHVAAADGSWDRIASLGGKHIDPALIGPAWSGDSTKLVAMLTEDLAGEIGVLENFLPPEKLAAK